MELDHCVVNPLIQNALGVMKQDEIGKGEEPTSTQIKWAMMTAIDRSKLVPGIFIMLWSPEIVFCRYSREAR